MDKDNEQPFSLKYVEGYEFETGSFICSVDDVIEYAKWLENYVCVKAITCEPCFKQL